MSDLPPMNFRGKFPKPILAIELGFTAAQGRRAYPFASKPRFFIESRESYLCWAQPTFIQPSSKNRCNPIFRCYSGVRFQYGFKVQLYFLTNRAVGQYSKDIELTLKSSRTGVFLC